MKVTCQTCRGQNEITDPAPEGWQYEFTDVNMRFNDDGTQSVDSRSGTRSVFWKCANVVPTADNPNALCGADNAVTEDWSETNTGSASDAVTAPVVVEGGSV